MQWDQNQGRCGVCGDPWHFETRPHEAGGQYAKGIIGRRYLIGQVIAGGCRPRRRTRRLRLNFSYCFVFQDIDIEVELTANHWGRFEMLLCPNNNPAYEATQGCLDR